MDKRGKVFVKLFNLKKDEIANMDIKMEKLIFPITGVKNHF